MTLYMVQLQVQPCLREHRADKPKDPGANSNLTHAAGKDNPWEWNIQYYIRKLSKLQGQGTAEDTEAEQETWSDHGADAEDISPPKSEPAPGTEETSVVEPTLSQIL